MSIADVAPPIRGSWPRTLSARVLLVLLAGMLVSHALSFSLLFFERYEATRSMMLRNLDEDVGLSVALLEHLSPAERAAWVPRLERRTYRYLLRPAAPGKPLHSRRAKQVTGLIDESLQRRYALDPRQVSRTPERFEVELRLHDGQPLTIEVTPAMLPLATWLPAVLVAQLLLLLACAWWVGRLALRPLSLLSDAVEGLQPGKVQAVSLPEAGPLETARAAAALNALQARIQGHVNERMQILAAISHDLQTPITRMKLRVESLPDGPVPQRLVDDLDQLGQLVREGLAYARSSHVASGEPVRLDLRAFVDSLAADYQDMGKPVLIGRCEAIAVKTWPQPLRRIVGNLVDNALRYGGSAEVSIGRAGHGAWLCVSDHGPGIPEQELERVLSPFHRLESSRSRETGGTGLGLAIAAQLAQSLGGNIELRNRQEGGLSAWVHLPALEADKPG